MKQLDSAKAIKELSITYAPINHTHAAKNITQDSNNRFVTDTEKDTWNKVITRIGSGANSMLVFPPTTIEGGSFYLDYVSLNLLEAGNSNLNTLKDYGSSKFYIQSNVSYASSANNYPMQSKGILEVLSTNDYAVQIFYPFELPGGSHYVRYFTGTAWTPWQKVYTSGNIPTLSELGAAAENHSHGLLHNSLACSLDNTTTDSGWSMINSSYSGFLLKSIRTQANAPSWIVNNYGAGIAFGGDDTKGVLSVSYSNPSIKIAGGNGTKPVWWIGLSGTNSKAYNLDSFSLNSHTHDYLPLSGGTLTGGISVNGESKFYSEKYSDPWQGTACAIKTAGHIATTGTLKSSALNVGTGGIDIENRIMQTRANEALYLYTAGKSEGVGFDYQGYVRPQGDSTWACGHPSWRWSIVYAQSGVSTGSDGKWKKHIKYIVSEEELKDFASDYIPSNNDYVMSTFTYEGDAMNEPSPVLSSTSSEKVYEFTKNLYAKDITLDITTNDLYKFFRDEFQLTSYRFNVDMYHGNDKRNNELNNVGFIAQDVVNTKVGKLFIIEPEDDELATKEEKGFTYNLQNYISIIAGALKSAIKEIESLKAEVETLRNK